MSSKLQQVGLVATGLIAGVLVSLNFSASAGKDAGMSSLPVAHSPDTRQASTIR